MTVSGWASSSATLGVIFTFTPLALICVALRLYTRRTHLGLDDVCVTAAMLFTANFAICVAVQGKSTFLIPTSVPGSLIPTWVSPLRPVSPLRRPHQIATLESRKGFLGVNMELLPWPRSGQALHRSTMSTNLRASESLSNRGLHSRRCHNCLHALDFLWKRLPLQTDFVLLGP